MTIPSRSPAPIRFKFAAKGNRPALNLFWYDGGIKPPTPEELEADNKELSRRRHDVCRGQGQNHRSASVAITRRSFRRANPAPIGALKAQSAPTASENVRGQRNRNSSWVKAFKGGAPTYGDFLLAGPISEAFNLGAISLRLGGKRLLWDAQNFKITNLPEANKYLVREYRKGWELTLASRKMPSSMLPETVIETQALTKVFGQQRALDAVNLKVAPGAIGLLGPNGAGKSTFMKCLLQLQPITSGSAKLLGREVGQEGREIRKRVGYTPGAGLPHPRHGRLRICDLLRPTLRIAVPGRAPAGARDAGFRRHGPGALPQDRHLLDRHEAATEAGPGHRA